MGKADGRVTLDANVLFYSFDPSVPAKQDRATGIIDAASLLAGSFLTIQTLGEFAHASSRKGILD